MVNTVLQGPLGSPEPRLTKVKTGSTPLGVCVCGGVRVQGWAGGGEEWVGGRGRGVGGRAGERGVWAGGGEGWAGGGEGWAGGERKEEVGVLCLSASFAPVS